MAPPPVFLSADGIAQRVGELAAQISRDYAGVDDLRLVGVLRGAFIFLADLSRRLTVPCSVDFVAVSRYEHGSTPSGDVRLIMDLRVPIGGRHVLLVEDIVDSGGTIAYLSRTLRARNPASLKICALTRKADRVPPELRIDYVGFDIPDRWVVGYGLDYNNQLRTLPYIGMVDPVERSDVATGPRAGRLEGAYTGTARSALPARRSRRAATVETAPAAP